MKERSKTQRAVVIFGAALLILGVLLNEWTLKTLFSPDGILEPPTKRTILIFNLFCVSVGLIFLIFDSFISRISNSFLSALLALKARRTIIFWAILFGIMLSPFLAGEFIVRATGRYATDNERFGEGYISPYKCVNYTPWLLTYSPNTTLHYNRQPEYDYEVRTNSEGIRDIEHPVEKPSNEYRIIGLGDSFTEGQGAKYDDTYLKVLERRLNRPSPSKRVRAISGGFVGSDPVFEYHLLVRRLLKYNPDFVILATNDSDIGDIIAMGGIDRFGPDGIVKDRPVPRLEWMFGHSRFIRGIMITLFGYDYYLLRPKARAQKEKMALSVILEVAQAIKSLAEKYGFQFLLVVHPFKNEVLEKNKPSRFLPLLVGCSEKGIDFVDLTNFFRTQIQSDHIDEYFWPMDMHCTAKGYDVLARGIEQKLRASYKDASFPWDSR